MKLENIRLGTQISGPVAVTGHTGFKGAWFTELLYSLSIETAGYSLEPIPDALYSKLNHRGKFREEYGDIRDLKKISQFIAQIKPEVVFHFAAQPLVLDSYIDPLSTFTTNITGTANLLEAGFKCDSVKAIIIVTTDKVYENFNTGVKFKESDPLMGKDPYSASKVGSEQAVSAWRQISKISGGPKVVSVRAGNVIGGGDVSSNRLLPDLIRAVSNDSKVTIRNPKSTRPWQHVLDPLVGYLQVAEYLLKGNDLRAINFSNPSPSLTVLEVIEIAAQHLGVSVDTLVELGSELTNQSEALTLDLDPSLAQSVIGWNSIWTQREAVVSTIDWWTSFNSKRASAAEACLVDMNRLSKRIPGQNQ